MPPEGRGAAVAAAVPHISIAQEALVSPAKRDRREARMAEIAEAVADLERHGTCWSDWARRNGFSLVATRNVLKLRHPCLRGESHRIAETILDGARWHRQPDGHAHAAPRIRDEAATTAEGMPPGLAQATAKMIHDCANAQAALGFCAVLLSDLLWFGYIPADEIDRARVALSLARSFSGGALSGAGRPAIPSAAETEDPA